MLLISKGRSYFGQSSPADLAEEAGEHYIKTQTSFPLLPDHNAVSPTQPRGLLSIRLNMDRTMFDLFVELH